MGSAIEKMLKRPVIIIKDYFLWKKSEAEFAKFVNKWKSNWEKTDHELKGASLLLSTHGQVQRFRGSLLPLHFFSLRQIKK